MSTTSPIEWTEATWNPIVGCSILSEGCTNCYAMRMARRLEKMGSAKYEGLTRQSGGSWKWNGNVRLDRPSLSQPSAWRVPKKIFVNSMSDLFHEALELREIQLVFEAMHQAPHHVYQILTKRAERLSALNRHLPWFSNVWMGVSVESKKQLHRIENLRQINATVKFLSLEPLIDDLGKINLRGIDWVIVGGESGPNSRPIKEEWVISILQQCKQQNVAFHFKQWGGVNKKKTGRKLLGQTWDEYPAV